MTALLIKDGLFTTADCNTPDFRKKQGGFCNLNSADAEQKSVAFLTLVDDGMNPADALTVRQTLIRNA